MTTEEWRDVEGWPGYEVSNLGQIRSWRKRPHERASPAEPRILKGGKSVFGYRSLILTKDTSTRKMFRIFHLVAFAWIGPRPTGMVLTHLNGNKLDDRAANLAYRTQRDNIQDCIKHGTMPRGEKHAKSKLTNDQARAILKDSRSSRDIAAELNIAECTVARIRSKRSWRWLEGAS